VVKKPYVQLPVFLLDMSLLQGVAFTRRSSIIARQTATGSESSQSLMSVCLRYDRTLWSAGLLTRDSFCCTTIHDSTMLSRRLASTPSGNILELLQVIWQLWAWALHTALRAFHCFRFYVRVSFFAGRMLDNESVTCKHATNWLGLSGAPDYLRCNIRAWL